MTKEKFDITRWYKGIKVKPRMSFLALAMR